jgi:hypothetical protein
MMSAVDSGDPSRPTRHARVPLDQVQGTDDVGVDSDGPRSVDFVHGHPWLDRSRLRPLPLVLLDARVPLDEVQGTDGASRRLRRERFRRLASAGTRGLPTPVIVIRTTGVRIHECPSDEVQTQSAERMMWGSTPTVVVPQTSSAGTRGFSADGAEGEAPLRPVARSSARTATTARARPLPRRPRS